MNTRVFAGINRLGVSSETATGGKLHSGSTLTNVPLERSSAAMTWSITPIPIPSRNKLRSIVMLLAETDALRRSDYGLPATGRQMPVPSIVYVHQMQPRMRLEIFRVTAVCRAV